MDGKAARKGSNGCAMVACQDGGEKGGVFEFVLGLGFLYAGPKSTYSSTLRNVLLVVRTNRGGVPKCIIFATKMDISCSI